MAISDVLQTISDPRSRAAYKARELATLNGTQRTWSVAGRTVSLSGIRAEGEALVFTLRVTMGGSTLFADTVHVVNPPVKVRTGGTPEEPVFEERPLQAVVEVVENLLKHKGVL